MEKRRDKNNSFPNESGSFITKSDDILCFIVQK